MPRADAAYRRERQRRCIYYLRRGGSLPAARELAKKDGFGANTSAWITALGEILFSGGTIKKGKRR